MHLDFNEFSLPAQLLGYAENNAVLRPVFSVDREPEGKIDLGHSYKRFMNIRKILHYGDRLNTAVLQDKIAVGSSPMQNMIVDAIPDGCDEPIFSKHGKFMRIAGRIDPDTGHLNEIKIALKDLSSEVLSIDGLPFRREFELQIPNDVQGRGGQACFEWFMAAYKTNYDDDSFSSVTFEDLVPTSAYMSARTGYYFLRKLPYYGVSLLSEACEDFFLPLASDLQTPLVSLDRILTQFEWETVGAFNLDGRGNNLSDEGLSNIGLKSMDRILKHLVQKIYPNDMDWRNNTLTDSKAEISRRISCERWATKNSNSGKTLRGIYDRVSKHEEQEAYIDIIKCSEKLCNLIDNPEVLSKQLSMADRLGSLRSRHNASAPDELRLNEALSLAA